MNFKMLSLRSPKGGQPIRMWTTSLVSGEQNLNVDSRGEVCITQQSLYCIKVGYYEDGQPVLVKDTEAAKLYQLLKRYYA